MSQSQKKEPNGGGSPRLSMDIKQIRNLVELMVENDLSRLELREGDVHILLRRGHAVPGALMPAMGNPGPAPVAPAAPAVGVPGEAAAPGERLIRSPMVGTFYSAADPESPPFVSVGSMVGPDTVVCLIEAMKVFNEIKADMAGQVTRVLVRNGEAVEFDQPLFALSAT